MFPPIILQQMATIFRQPWGFADYADADRGLWTYGLYIQCAVYCADFRVYLFLDNRSVSAEGCAKNLRDRGSFIPGLRPGHRTAEYLETVMTRITFYASFLAIIAVVPSVSADIAC